MNKKLWFVFLLLIAFLLTLSACGSTESHVEYLHMEERFGFTLPENGTVEYDSFINIGFDFVEYCVIVYEDTQALEKLDWSELKDEDRTQFNKWLDLHNECLFSDKKGAIPDQYLPNYDNVEKIFLTKTMQALMLYDSEKATVYVYLIKM